MAFWKINTYTWDLKSDLLLSPTQVVFFLFLFFNSFSLGFWAWVLSLSLSLSLSFLSFHFSQSLLFSVFPLLVLSKLYSVICCCVEGVGGVNGWIYYGGLVWCFVVCMMMVFVLVGSWVWWMDEKGGDERCLRAIWVRWVWVLGVEGKRKKRKELRSKSCPKSIRGFHKKLNFLS